MDKEEGELSCSEEETNLAYEDFDYKELQRPKMPFYIHNHHTSDYLDKIKTGTDSASTDSSEDSSDSAPPNSKLRMKEKVNHNHSHHERMADGDGTSSGFNNPNFKAAFYSVIDEKTEKQLHYKTDSAIDKTYEVMASSYQSKKTNNVWSDVIKEQTVGSAADELGLLGFCDAKKITRGPESFVIENNLKRKYMEIEDKEFEFEDKEFEFEDTNSNESFSSTGLSEDSKEFLSQQDVESGIEKVKKIRNDDQKLKQRILMTTSSMSDEMFCKFVAKRLRERKSQLILSVAKYLGRDVVAHLFTKTLLILKRGGILIKTGTRKRTPGGIFLYLLRGNKKWDVAMLAKIFEEPPEFQHFSNHVSPT